MINIIDHVVILVGDLDVATADYTALGFTVVPGGEHADGLTRNALVAFADASYLELLAYTRPLAALPPIETLSPLGRRWRARAATGVGLIDFALRPEDMAVDLVGLQDRGLAMEGPIPGARLRPDGQRVAWQIAVASTPDLPFLCADLTAHHLRVPAGDARKHANGAEGIAGLLVAVQDYAASARRYRALLGSRAGTTDLHARPYFRLRDATITLVAPAMGDDPLNLGATDERPYGLFLRTARGTPEGWLDPARTHGARIRMGGATRPSVAGLL